MSKQNPDEGRYYDEKTHQWVEGAAPAKARRARKAAGDPADPPPAAEPATQATEE